MILTLLRDWIRRLAFWAFWDDIREMPVVPKTDTEIWVDLEPQQPELNHRPTNINWLPNV